MKTRLSPFLSGLIPVIISVGILILYLKLPDIIPNFSRVDAYKTKNVFDDLYWMIFSLPLLPLFMLAPTFLGELSDRVELRYRLKPVRGGGYQTQVLKLWLMIIPHWGSIHKKYHHYKAQNIFGAKWDSCYTTNKSYSKEESLKKLEEHKKNIIRERRRYFSLIKEDRRAIEYI